jgi:hypothetical protein
MAKESEARYVVKRKKLKDIGIVRPVDEVESVKDKMPILCTVKYCISIYTALCFIFMCWREMEWNGR